MANTAGPVPKPTPLEEFVWQTEQAVLGLLLRSPAKMREALETIDERDFVDEPHQWIIGAMRWLHSQGKPVTPFSLPPVLGPDREVAQGVTVAWYVQELVTKAMTQTAGMPLEHLLDTLREARIRREFRHVAISLSDAAIDGGADLQSAFHMAAEQIDDIICSGIDKRRRNLNAKALGDLVLEHIENGEQTWPTTGLADLDQYLGGWPRGQLSILAGRPGMGKSAAATSCLLRAAKAGHNCQFFSLEMTGEQLGARLLTDLAFTAMSPIHYDDIQHHRLDDRQRQRLRDAKQHLDGLPLEVIEQRGLPLADIAARARRRAAALDRKNERLDVIFVDHIGLVHPSDRYAGNRVRELAEITDTLATLAKELDCAVVGLCQLNRGVEKQENKRPGLGDLRDSGAIEEDASTVTFLFRPAYYLENTKEDDPSKESDRLQRLEGCRNLLEFVVSKNRNGRVGVVKAWVDIGANAIRNLSYGV
jgi:replicative DNA helicase